jgi:hypothetical protein
MLGGGVGDHTLAVRAHRVQAGTVAFALFAALAALPACDGRTALPDPGSKEASNGLPNAALSAPASTPDAGGEPPTEAPAEVQQDLMARWNAVATAGDSAFDFHWTVFEAFPHPTYKGGSAPAYQAFAAVLLAFFQGGDNFDFLFRNHLFTLHLTHVFPSGQSGLDTTFQALATFFAAPGSFGDIPLDVRQGLQGFVDRMQPTLIVLDQLPDASPPDYVAMCRHYCEALHETGIYVCAKRSNDAAGCKETTPTADLCYELRCAPRLVEPSLCLTQCDSLRVVYDELCADGTGPADLCATPSAEHDRGCRDGC